MLQFMCGGVMSAVGLLSTFSLYWFHKFSLSHTHTHTFWNCVFKTCAVAKETCAVFHHGNSTVHIFRHIVR